MLSRSKRLATDRWAEAGDAAVCTPQSGLAGTPGVSATLTSSPKEKRGKAYFARSELVKHKEAAKVAGLIARDLGAPVQNAKDIVRSGESMQTRLIRISVMSSDRVLKLLRRETRRGDTGT